MSRRPRDPIRLAVVGTGAIAQVVHIPIFAERNDVDLVALADADSRKAEALSRRFSVPLVMEVDEVMEYDELDAVVVCTPNSSHEQIVLSALRAGKHVFVERPIATTVAAAERMIAVAGEAGLSLTVGLPHRHRPEAMALRDFVRGGEMGSVRSVRGSRLMRRLSPSQPTWRQSKEEAGGGALVDLGVTVIDLCLWIVGYPKVVRVSCVASPDGSELERAASLMFVAEDGTAFTIEVDNAYPGQLDRWFTGVIASEGTGTYPPLAVAKEFGGRPVDVTPRLPKPRGGEDAYTNAYRRQLDEFVKVVGDWGDEAEREYVPPTEQVALMRLVEAAYASVAVGREVVLGD